MATIKEINKAYEESLEISVTANFEGNNTKNKYGKIHNINNNAAHVRFIKGHSVRNINWWIPIEMITVPSMSFLDIT